MDLVVYGCWVGFDGAECSVLVFEALDFCGWVGFEFVAGFLVVFGG